MGASSSTSISEQRAEAYLSQQFYGSCDITCTNIMSGINIDIINSYIGGDISLTQRCSVDANCMVSGSSDASSDVMFKAANSTNAKNAGDLFGGAVFNFDSAGSESRQDIKQTIIQSTTEKCKLASLNSMTDVSILAANSTIGGSIKLGQTGSTQGTCQLQSNLSAAATATAMATNKATSGKDKKGQKKGSKAGIGSIIGFIVVMIVVFIIARMFTSGQAKKAMASAVQLAVEARGKAGCPGGTRPIMNPKTGKPVIDPATMRPICPPPSFTPLPPPVPAAPTINVELGKLLSNVGVSRTPTPATSAPRARGAIRVPTKIGKK